MIYGSDATSAAALRNTSGKLVTCKERKTNLDFENRIVNPAGRGLLATSGSRNLLPVLNTCCPGDPTNSCAAAQSCFVAGILIIYLLATILFHFNTEFVYKAMAELPSIRS